MLLYRTIILSLLISLFWGCTKKKEELPVSDSLIDVPVQEFEKTTLHFFSKGTLQWKLNADYMCKPLADTGLITVVPVVLTLFDSIGGTRSRVLADSGKIAANMASYNVWGNVYIRTKDSMVVRTHRLKWFKERQKVESDTFVQIETKKGDILRGKGLDATEDFTRFSFKSEVTGFFPNFEKRVETNDDKIY